MTKRYHIPNQHDSRKDPNPTPRMMLNRWLKLVDDMTWKQACKFIPAVDYARGVRFAGD